MPGSPLCFRLQRLALSGTFFTAGFRRQPCRLHYLGMMRGLGTPDLGKRGGNWSRSFSARSGVNSMQIFQLLDSVFRPSSTLPLYSPSWHLIQRAKLARDVKYQRQISTEMYA